MEISFWLLGEAHREAQHGEARQHSQETRGPSREATGKSLIQENPV